MYYVYVLKNSVGKFYVGRTSDLKRRLAEHLNQKTWTTKRLKVFELIFYEAFKIKDDAIRGERYFKTNKGKKGLKIILRESKK